MKSLKILTALLACAAFAAFAGDDDFEVPERGETGHVTIKTDPQGSKVYLDGEELGKTPIVNREFPTGRFDLIIIEEGRRQQIELVNQRFNVWPDKNGKQDQRNVFEQKTRMPWGNLELTTTPGKCQVMIDGELADRTDGGTLTMRNIREGDHLIEIKCGGATADTLVRIIGEETLKVHLKAGGKRRR